MKVTLVSPWLSTLLLLATALAGGCTGTDLGGAVTNSNGRRTAPLPAHSCADGDPLVEALLLSGASVETEPGDGSTRCRVTTPDGESHDMECEVTSKGNGCLSTGGLLVRVFDVHDDGIVYEPPCLSIRFVGSDMIVEGFATHTEAPFTTVPVRGVFRFDTTTRRYQISALAGPVGFAWITGG